MLINASAAEEVRMAVVEECTFDRGEASHALNLFDMHAKYADVVSLATTRDYLASLPAGLFDEQMPSLREARAGIDASSATAVGVDLRRGDG